MGKLLKNMVRLGAFALLVLIVFLTNIVDKLGFTSNDAKDDGKNSNDLFASFTSIPTAHADVPNGSGGEIPGPNCDAGPCPGGAPH